MGHIEIGNHLLRRIQLRAVVLQPLDIPAGIADLCLPSWLLMSMT